jgi:hypothetical protein
MLHLAHQKRRVVDPQVVLVLLLLAGLSLIATALIARGP